MSFLDPIEDWCPAWAYGTCACPQMCPDDRMTTNRAPLSRCADCRRADGGARVEPTTTKEECDD